VFLARGGGARARSAFPGDEAARALVGVGQGDGLAQPGIEFHALHGKCLAGHGAAHHRHVVVGVARTDDEHAFVAQRRQRLPRRKVRTRVEVGTQAELHAGDVGGGESHEKRHEHAMVIAAPRVEVARQVRRGEPARHVVGQLRRTRRRPGQIVGMRRKAVIIEQQTGRLLPLHRETLRFPVRRDDDERARPPWQRARQRSEKGLQPRPRIGWLPVHEKTRPAPVGKKQNGLAGCRRRCAHESDSRLRCVAWSIVVT
jgi:hypothetical protein